MTTEILDAETWRERWLLSHPSAGTRATYDAAISRWFAFCRRCGLEAFAAEQHHGDAYRNELVDEGLAPSTVARHLATASSYYRHVLRHGRPAPLDRNPLEWVGRPKVDTVSRRPGLNADEAALLRQVAISKDPRTAALVHLLLGTAVRVSEAVGATVDGLGWTDDGDRSLAVVRKGGRPDVVVVEPGDWAVIEQYLAGRRDVPGRWLFSTTGGRQMTRQTAYRLVREVADVVTGDRKRIGPHRLRATFATLALSAGQPIQEVQGALRHASAATTERYDTTQRERGRGAARAVANLWTETAR